MVSDKHAYLVIAHKNDLTFQTLLQMIDDERNDIFIHMDEKNTEYDIELVRKNIKYSQVFHSSRTNVNWGGYSQINAEFLLLELATGIGKYSYYHLISGEDLPIKTQSFIHGFFEKNQGKEFIRFESSEFNYSERIKYYYLFQEKIGRNRKRIALRMINRVSLYLQKVFGVNRSANMKFQKGTNWFSITDELARYICKQKEWVSRTFRNTLCCDEVFLQTMVLNSNFNRNIFHKEFDNDPVSIMRLIDWQRGNPYIFSSCDFEELKASKMLFARKFDASINKEIILKVCNELGEKYTS